jgi:NitT/TauT family transport system substrate-binding protein
MPRPSLLLLLAAFLVSTSGCEHPKTVAAFQRGLGRAADESLDRTKIEPLLQEFAKIDRDVASLTRLPGFRTPLNAKPIQRISKLMAGFGVLSQEIDVSPLLLKPPPPRPSAPSTK